MDSVRKISLHSRLWIAALAAAALSIGTWSIAPAPANAGVAIGVGIPFPGLYAQYPYYPYPPAYYPYYPPPPAYSPAGPQLYTSTELCASGRPVGRQHRQTIEPTRDEPLAGSAGQPTAVSILSTAPALLKDVKASAAYRRACRENLGSHRASPARR